VDGSLYVLIALFTVMQATFSSDEAYKYVPPHLKFWLMNTIEWALAAVSALKMFRSTSYGEHLENKKKEQDEKTNTDLSNTTV
jgi:hypothetical protein